MHKINRITSCWPLMLTLGLCGVGTPVCARPPRLMKTMRQVAVYGGPNRAVRPVARIDFGSVLLVASTSERSGCGATWGVLPDGTYVCTRYLSPVSGNQLSDKVDGAAPDGGADRERYVVKKGGTVGYLKRSDFVARRHPWRFYKGTVLLVNRIIGQGKNRYLVTSEGSYVHMENTRPMNPILRLGVDLSQNGVGPGGFAIDDQTPVFERPTADAPVVGHLEKFQWVPGPLSVDGAFVRLGERRYVLDSQLARFRKPAAGLAWDGDDERWISVDLTEQVVVAWLGERPVRIFLASTGKKGNTQPGRYRVKWKRRRQTMNLYRGHLRVEDVRWVMYYIPSRGFALHSAWHNQFGRPVSHGCVNLPELDARWLYEWASPHSAPYESENFHTSYEKGTRVVVF